MNIDRRQPSVSVVIPIYNTEDYLPKCLDSIINQSFKDFEIICVNDGTKDKSGEILNDYSKRDSRIIVINKENGGLSSARNAGLAVASAEFIGFVDSDDWLEPDAYMVAYHSIGDSDIAMFGTNVVGDAMMDRRDGDNEYYRVKYSGVVSLTDEIRLNTDVAAWNKLYRKSIIEKYNIVFPEGLLYEDYSFYWEYILKCNTATYIPNKFYNYLRRENSIMADTFNGQRRAIEHMRIFENVFKNVSIRGDWVGRESTLNSMFLNCFWFAYINSPDNMKKSVLKLGTKQVVECDLVGHPDIDKLRVKDYRSLIPDRNPEFRTLLARKILGFLEKTFNVDFTSFRMMITNHDLGSRDVSNSVATTAWVNANQVACGVERWNTVYDSAYSEVDICGGSDIDISFISPQFSRGDELKIMVSMWDTECAILHGTALNTERLILSTVFNDGISLFATSVDIDLSRACLRIHSNNLKNMEVKHIPVAEFDVERVKNLLGNLYMELLFPVNNSVPHYQSVI